MDNNELGTDLAEVGTDCISRRQAIETFKDCAVNGVGIDGIVYALNQLPPIQPKRGKWIKTARWGRVYYCDQCRNYLDFDGVNAGRGNTNFCPNCGADMRGEQDDESRSNSNAQTDTRARGMGATDKSSGI